MRRTSAEKPQKEEKSMKEKIMVRKTDHSTELALEKVLKETMVAWEKLADEAHEEGIRPYLEHSETEGEKYGTSGTPCSAEIFAESMIRKGYVEKADFTALEGVLLCLYDKATREILAAKATETPGLEITSRKAVELRNCAVSGLEYALGCLDRNAGKPCRQEWRWLWILCYSALRQDMDLELLKQWFYVGEKTQKH